MIRRSATGPGGSAVLSPRRAWHAGDITARSANMRAVVVDPTYLERRGRRRQATATVEVRDLPKPEPPAPGWVVVRPVLSGICISDLALLAGSTTPSPLAAYGPPGPVIPGHEIVGIVESAHRTSRVREGMRVIVDAQLRCRQKGLPECARCRAGEGQLCENRDRSGPVCDGAGIGSSPSAGGGWSEAILAHEEMLLSADTLSDQRAVLAEPTATALHAAMRWERNGDRVLVIGSGTKSRLIVATLAKLHPGLDITVVYDARHNDRASRFGRARREAGAHLQVDFAGEVTAIEHLGAARVWRASADELISATADLTGARMLRADDVAPVLDRGFDAAFVCRTTESSVDLGMRLVRAGGTLVVVGRAGRQIVDWSLVWHRELTIAGATGHSRERNGWRALHIAREWLSDPTFPVDGLVTHRFPLEDVSKALAIARAGATIGAVKVVLEDAAAPSITRGDEINTDVLDDTPLLGAVAAKVRG